jgi:phosphate transport system protein
MHETRHQFREDLKELERQTLEGLDLVVAQLDRALESLSDHNVALAAIVIADDARIDERYIEVHQGLLSLLARQTPVAGDLRMIAALLHINRCVERMGDQCANIAKLVPLAGEPPPNKGTEIPDAIERMGALARGQIIETKEAFRTRNVALVGDLISQSSGIGPLNREIFNRAVEIGDHIDAREWAMFMILVARAVERIADNAVEIAEQTVFVVTGLFREFTDAPQLAGKQAAGSD